MGSRFIPVAAPVFAGNEKAYVQDCVDSTWISSNGKYIPRFETALAEFCGVNHAVACCNGTTALHLALLALGVKPGDEIIVPTLTFIATANAVTYCGARPVFVDSEPRTWNMDPALIEAKITAATRGIIVVHLYGQPADMDSILAIARRHSLFIVEDAAEAHGAQYRGRRAGSIGLAGTLSFYGNKILTTGEGGAVVTNDDKLANAARLLRDQAMDAQRRYWFTTVGYNYRMTNIEAAIGLAQLEKATWHMQRRLECAAWYREELGGIRHLTFQSETPESSHAFWMVTVLLDEQPAAARDEMISRLLDDGIETRPVFYPVHSLPPYRDPTRRDVFPVADRIARQGISLPTWAGLTRDDVRFVAARFRTHLKT